MSTSEEKYISPRRLNDFKTLLESEYNIDKHSNQIQSLLNREAKNLLDFANLSKVGGTAVINKDDDSINAGSTSGSWISAAYTLPILPAGTYTFSALISDYSKSGGDVRIIVTKTIGGQQAVGGKTLTANGKIEFNFVSSGEQLYLLYYPNYSSSSYTNSFTASQNMICTAEDYAISPEFVPYAPSNRELYVNQQVSFGKLVYQTVHNSSYTSTYSMKTSDFGNGPAGLYMIFIISWATSPTISIYSMAYSGGVTSQSTLTKISGTDVNISLTGDTVTYTGAGKIQIVAMNAL